MMLNLYHKRLKIWKLSIELLKQVYQFSHHFPETEKFGLRSQIQRAAISVCSNIAEGSARFSNLEKRRFFEIARSSLVEIDTQIEIAIQLAYIKPECVEPLAKDINILFAMFCRYLDNLAKRK